MRSATRSILARVLTAIAVFMAAWGGGPAIPLADAGVLARSAPCRAVLNGAQETPPVATPATGVGSVQLINNDTQIRVNLTFSNLTSAQTLAHIHGPAGFGQPASPQITLPTGQITNQDFAISPVQVQQLKAGLTYFNVHTSNNTGGEIRGQIICATEQPVDFDGDIRGDFGIYRPSNGLWFAPASGGGAPYQIFFGSPGDVAIRGNFCGDGRTEAAIFRPNNQGGALWYAPCTGVGGAFNVILGQPGDVPIPGDYDRDGITDAAIFRPGNQLWFAALSGGGSLRIDGLGQMGDHAVPADYDGDGCTDFAIFRPSAGLWFAAPSCPGGTPYQIFFGDIYDVPVPGDYDGDGKVEAGTFRPDYPPVGLWYAPLSGGGAFNIIFGQSGDVPVPADYDNDGKTDAAIFRASGGLHFAVLSNGGTRRLDGVGQAGDVPVGRRVSQ